MSAFENATAFALGWSLFTTGRPLRSPAQCPTHASHRTAPALYPPTHAAMRAALSTASHTDKRDMAPSASSSATRTSSSAFFVAGGFSALGVSGELVHALAKMGIDRPTSVQSRTIPALLAGVDVVIGAATGSGKTLAYLVPVIHSLKVAEKLREVGDAPLRIARRPRAVVLVPTRELAEQVLAVAKELSHTVKFRVIGAIGGSSGTMRKLKDSLMMPVDVIVATTGRMCQLLKDRVIDLRFVSHVVVDEVDTMFDEGFGPELKRILAAARGSAEHANSPQCIAAGATHPRAAEGMYAEEFPRAKRIDVDLHRPPPGLQQRFVSVNAKTKLSELVALLGEAKADGMLRGGRMIIFCNTMDSCRFVDHFLSESGYSTSCVHGDVPSAKRELHYAAFKKGQSQLLVCTDMAARGLDNLSVDHVVIFDFPTSAVDYIHRAGRTARAGAKGKVTSFVMRKDERLAAAIEKAAAVRDDTLERARKAREEEQMRKAQDEAKMRERERLQAKQVRSDGAAALETVPFSRYAHRTVRSTRTAERGNGSSARGRGARGRPGFGSGSRRSSVRRSYR